MKAILVSLFLVSSLFISSQTLDLNGLSANISANAKVDFGAFTLDISGSYGISSKKIEDLHLNVGMEGGDIFMALEINKITKKPLDEIASVWKGNKTKGWGAMAKDLGIKPGSAEFHALKAKAKGKADKGKKGGNSKGGPPSHAKGGKGKGKK